MHFNLEMRLSNNAEETGEKMAYPRVENSG